MLLACAYVGHVAASDLADLAVKQQLSLSFYEGPYLRAVVVLLVADVLAGLEDYVFHQGVRTGLFPDIVLYHLVLPPAPLFEHGALLQPGHIGLDVFAAVLVRHEYAVGAGRHYYVVGPYAQAGNVETVHYMRVVRV